MSGIVRVLGFSLVALLAPLAVVAGAAEPALPRVSVTVVVVLATAQNNVVDPKLSSLAKEVQKRDPQLVGFQIAGATSKSIALGSSETYDLPENQSIKVTVDKPRGEDGRIGLSIEPPGLGRISYNCACSKFFPIVTDVKTRKNETLILTIMAKPCSLHADKLSPAQKN